MPRRIVQRRPAGDANHLADWNRPRPLEPVSEQTLDVRLEASAAAGRKLLHALQSGTREFILTSRDGKTSAAVRLSIDGSSVTEHMMAGHLVSVDWGHGTVQCRLDRIGLSRTELRLLAALLEAQGGPRTRADLIATVWPDEWDAGLDRGNALGVYVCTLRKRLATIGVGSALKTVRGLGYQIVG